MKDGRRRPPSDPAVEAASTIEELLASTSEDYDQGRVELALARARTGLRLARSALDRAAEVSFLNKLGVYHQALGRLQRAGECFDQAMSILDDPSNGLARREAEPLHRLVLSNVAVLLDLRGAYDDSIPLYEHLRALALEDQELREVARMDLNLGFAHAGRDEYDRAMACWERALEFYEKGGSLPQMCKVLLNMAGLYLFRHEPQNALVILDEARPLVCQWGDLEACVRLCSFYGQACRQERDLESAVEWLEEAAAWLEHLRGGRLTEAGRLAFQDDNASLHDHLVLTLCSLGRAERALDFVEKWRSRVLLERIGHQATRPRHADGPLREALFDVHRRLAEQQGHPSEYAEVLVETQLADPAGHDIVTREAAATADVRRLMEPGVAILTWHLHGDRMETFLVRREGVSAVSSTPGAARLEALCGYVRAQCSGSSEEGPDDLHALELLALAPMHFLSSEGRRAARLRASRELYELVLGPVEPFLEGVRRLGIRPCGPLHDVPFGALVDTGGRYLVERWSLFRVPSLSIWSHQATARSTREGRGRGVLFVGAPELGPLESALPPLRGAARELEGIAARMPEGSPMSVLMGEQATRRRVEADLSRFDILHLACHADLNSLDPTDLALRLSPEEGDDGRWTAADLALARADLALVVLSACQTGRVRDDGGDLQGLVRAFLALGAPEVLATLWRIDDEATPRLIEDFYAALPGCSTADALARAQRAQLARDPDADPSTWSSFQLYGVG